MTRYLHTLSATLFYVLGTGFFVAYILQVNKIAAAASSMWLERGILPLLCVAFLFGGTSVYLSITNEHKPSRALALSIAIPLALLFLAYVFLKFWHTA